MRLRLGVGDALVGEPAVEIVQRLERHARREEPFTHHADLVFDLSFLPAGRRTARRRLHQMMAHQLLEAPVELAVLPGEHRFHGGFHIVVDATERHAFEQDERLFVRVEHHFLALAHIGAGEDHPAVAEPDLRHLHRRRHAIEHDNLVAPVELKGFARRKAQRHERRRRPFALAHSPHLPIAPDSVVAARIAAAPQFLEHALIGQPLTPRDLGVGRQHRLQRRHVIGQLRQRLILAHVAVLGFGLGADDVAHRVARKVHLARDSLDLFALNEVRAPHLPNCVHRQHLPLGLSRDSRTRGQFHHPGEGSKFDADSPQIGVKFARRFTFRGSQFCTQMARRTG